MIFSIGESLRIGWKIVTTHFWFFVGAMLIVVIGSSIPGAVLALARVENEIAIIIANILSGVIGIILEIGFLKLALSFVRTGNASYVDFYRYAKLFFKYLAVKILLALVVIAGLILFIIPGIVWALRFQFATYLVVDRNMGPLQAMRQSSVMTAGYKWDLLGLHIVLGIVGLLGVLALLVGIFIAAPIALIARTFVYDAFMRMRSKSSEFSSTL